jgi:hypothetical protein
MKGYRVGGSDIAAWVKEKTGFGVMRIKRIYLVNVLLKAAEEKKITIRFGR